MKSFPKILKIVFATIFLLQTVSLLFLITVPKQSRAANVNFTPQVTVGNFQQGATIQINPNSIGSYIQSIYNYAIGIVGILAVIVMMVGGFLWLTAGGNAGQITEAQEWIKGSIIGLVLALSSYLILATINPDLVNLKPIQVRQVSTVQTFGCCQDNTNTCSMKSFSDCKGYWNKDYTCDSGSGKCKSPSGAVGVCDPQNGILCPYPQYCINSICYDGSVNSPCNDPNNSIHQCQSGLNCALGISGGICTIGKNGDPCCVDSDCPNSTNKKCSRSASEACASPSNYVCQ